jgi:hypothetical protein
MKPITVIASILSLALAATAAPALQPRWCTVVCCCPTNGCAVGSICEDPFLDEVQYCCHQDLETVPSSSHYSKRAIPAADLLYRLHLWRLLSFMRMVLALLNRLGLNEVGMRDIWLEAMTTARGGCYEYLCNVDLIFAGFSSLPYFKPLCPIALFIA